jgi:hypothetical protein
LAGCAGGGWSLFGNSSLFGSDTAAADPEPAPKKSVAESATTKVALNAVVGPPDALGRQLAQEITSALEKQRVAVVGRDEKADYNLRPYVLAAKEKAGIKVSYVLDVSDATGKRVNRFAGEELVPPGGSADPWASVTPSVAQLIAAKATGNLASWLPNAQAVASSSSSSSGAAPPSASKEKQDAQEKEIAAAPPPRAQPKTKQASVSSSGPTTGSLGLKVVVPPVTGAPGDGNTSLSTAIQRELQGKGISLADRPSSTTHRVEGVVTLGAAREGKQAIQIEWVVKDPQGKRLGTVSQKNDIPEGSLDGSWGPVANQAAGAAVQGIFKLLPQGEASAVN